MSIAPVVLRILVYALGLLLLLAALLVVIPFGVQASGKIRAEGPQASVSCAWAFGLLRLALSFPGAVGLRLAGLRLWHGTMPPLRRRNKSPKPGRRERKERRDRHRISALERGRILVGVAWRLVRALRLQLTARGAFGLGDPADTAILFAVVQGLGRLPGVRLALKPNYFEEELTIDVELSGRVWLVHLGAIAVGLLLNGRTRKALLAS